ncbi:MAG: hypothetical protein Q4G33_12760 [bacterium]|nr:hypothetical protein [bacterium]
MDIIKCKFLNKDGEPRGREYSYFADFEVKPGEYVDVPQPRMSNKDVSGTKKVLCVAVNVPEEEIAPFRELVKTAVRVHIDDERELDE